MSHISYVFYDWKNTVTTHSEVEFNKEKNNKDMTLYRRICILVVDFAYDFML